MKQLDTQDADQWVNVGLYGPPGTGKTTFGVTASGLGPVLILLSEHQGMVHIREAANRLKVPVPRVMAMDDVQDYRDVLKALHGDRSKPFRIVNGSTGEVIVEWKTWPATVVLDSTTDLCARILVDDIRRRAPQTKGSDGLPKDADRYWNTLGDMAKNLIRAYRDAPCHTIFLCLMDDKTVGRGQNETRKVTPSLPMRKLADDVAAAVNAMGHTYRVASDGRVQYAVMLTGPSFHTHLKQCAPLRNIEVADFTSWVKRLHDIEVVLEETPDTLPDDFEGLSQEGMDGSDTSAEGSGVRVNDVSVTNGHDDAASFICEACGEKPVDIEGQLCEDCEPPALTEEEKKQQVEAEMERQEALLDKVTVPEAVTLVKTAMSEGLLRTWKERDSRKGVVDAIDARLLALAKGRATVARSANA